MALIITDDKGNLYDVVDGNLTIKAQPPVVVVPPPASGEVRPANAVPNRTIPTASGLIAFRTASMGTLTMIRDTTKRQSYLAQVDGNLCPGVAQPTTGQLLLAGWKRWLSDMLSQADYIRAQAVVESNWYQWKADGTPSHGDIGNGDSWGIMQAKPRDNQASYPLTANSTGFNIDYYLMMLAAIFNGDVAYLGETSTPKVNGLAVPYLPATRNVARMRLAIGAWYSGQWGDSGALQYLAQIDAALAKQPWAAAGF